MSAAAVVTGRVSEAQTVSGFPYSEKESISNPASVSVNYFWPPTASVAEAHRDHFALRNFLIFLDPQTWFASPPGDLTIALLDDTCCRKERFGASAMPAPGTSTATKRSRTIELKIIDAARMAVPLQGDGPGFRAHPADSERYPTRESTKS